MARAIKPVGTIDCPKSTPFVGFTVVPRPQAATVPLDFRARPCVMLAATAETPSKPAGISRCPYWLFPQEVSAVVAEERTSALGERLLSAPPLPVNAPPRFTPV